jgi:ADP-L-glycero-D-manno-heptose 6-epimerase
VIIWMMNNKIESSLYNIGTSKARTFYDLASLCFKFMQFDKKIEFIDIPNDLKDIYQSFTEADIYKLKKQGYKKEFHTLEQGIKNYVNILKK